MTPVGQEMMGTPAKERQKAYMRRAEELGFKRVNLMVPAERHTEIHNMARQMCDEERRRKPAKPLSQHHRSFAEETEHEIASLRAAANDHGTDTQNKSTEQRVGDCHDAARLEQELVRTTQDGKYRRAAFFFLAGVLGYLTGPVLTALWHSKASKP